MSEQLTKAVTVANGQVVTTSLQIAEVFGKQHKNVIQAIESLQVPDGARELNFQRSEYTAQNGIGKNVKYPMYQITRDGFTLLAMGFTGAKAMEFKLAYIEAFNRMEEQLKHGKTQPELPLSADWIEVNGKKVMNFTKLASMLGLRTGQMSYLYYGYQHEFDMSADVLRQGRRLFLTESGVKRAQELKEAIKHIAYARHHRYCLPYDAEAEQPPTEERKIGGRAEDMSDAEILAFMEANNVFIYFQVKREILVELYYALTRYFLNQQLEDATPEAAKLIRDSLNDRERPTEHEVNIIINAIERIGKATQLADVKPEYHQDIAVVIAYRLGRLNIKAA